MENRIGMVALANMEALGKRHLFLNNSGVNGLNHKNHLGSSIIGAIRKLVNLYYFSGK